MYRLHFVLTYIALFLTTLGALNALPYGIEHHIFSPSTKVRARAADPKDWTAVPAALTPMHGLIAVYRLRCENIVFDRSPHVGLRCQDLVVCNGRDIRPVNGVEVPWVQQLCRQKCDCDRYLSERIE